MVTGHNWQDSVVEMIGDIGLCSKQKLINLFIAMQLFSWILNELLDDSAKRFQCLLVAIHCSWSKIANFGAGSEY